VGPLKPWLAAGALAVAFGAGWAVNGWRVGAALSDLKAAHARSMLLASEAAAETLAARTAERDAAQDQVTQIAAAGTAALEKTNVENDRMRRCIAAGTCGVRVVAGVCPPSTPGLPPTASGGGVDSAAGAILAPAVGQAVLDLRAGIERTETTLKACQASLGVLATTPSAP